MEHCMKAMKLVIGGRTCGRPATRWYSCPFPLDPRMDMIIVRCDEHARNVSVRAVEISRSEAEVLTVLRS